MSKVSTVEAGTSYLPSSTAPPLGRNGWCSPSGKELAAVVPIEDVKLLEESEDRLDFEAAREALKAEVDHSCGKGQGRIGAIRVAAYRLEFKTGSSAQTCAT